MKQFDAEILQNRAVADSWRELVLSWDEAASEPRPGQFLTLRVSPFSDPLLRRPFAFSGFRRAFSGFQRADDAATARASVVYQIRGGATRLLSRLAPGSRVDTLAPLGSCFPTPLPGETPVLAGGGIGLGPLLFLADTLSVGVLPAESGPPLFVFGVRSSALLPAIALPAGSALCTDDGSSGFHGTVVDYLARNAPTPPKGGRLRLYGCGPGPMLAALATLAAERGWAASLSAEQWMACGVGACMGCALPRADGKGYLRACTDGPVFEAADIDWSGRS